MNNQTVNDYFKHHWVKLMLFALFTAAVSFFAPLKNFQLKWLIDSKSKQEALGYMGLVFLITFTSWFFERLSRRSFTKLACGAVEQVRGQVMERVLRRPVSQYQREGDAAYLSLLTTDLRTLYDDYYMSLFNIAFWGGIMLCALGMYLYISPVMLAAILLVTVPPLVLPRKMNERLKASRDAFSLQMAGYTQQLKELLGGFEVIRGFLREDAYAARHRDAARQARDSEQAYQQSLNAMVVNTSLISNLIFPIVMLVGLFLAFDGRLTMGTVSTAASMANFVITPCNQIAQCWAKVKSSQGIRQRLEAAMAEPQATEQGEPIGPIDSIQCETVRFAYPNTAEPVLKDASLTVDAAQKVALVGESGCGKSTIAALLSGSRTGYTGSVTLGGVPVQELQQEQRLRTLTLVPHNATIFKGTVEANLRMAKPDATEAELWAALEQVNLADFCRSQDGLQTALHEGGSNLSGGQRQRLAMARALLHDTPIYLFDEATSNVDAESENDIMAAIRSLAGRKTVILISHRLANVVDSDCIYVLEAGRIAEQGKHEALLAEGGVYSRLYNAQKQLEDLGEVSA